MNVLGLNENLLCCSCGYFNWKKTPKFLITHCRAISPLSMHLLAISIRKPWSSTILSSRENRVRVEEKEHVLPHLTSLLSDGSLTSFRMLSSVGGVSTWGMSNSLSSIYISETTAWVWVAYSAFQTVIKATQKAAMHARLCPERRARAPRAVSHTASSGWLKIIYPS